MAWRPRPRPRARARKKARFTHPWRSQSPTLSFLHCLPAQRSRSRSRSCAEVVVITQGLRIVGEERKPIQLWCIIMILPPISPGQVDERYIRWVKLIHQATCDRRCTPSSKSLAKMLRGVGRCQPRASVLAFSDMT